MTKMMPIKKYFFYLFEYKWQFLIKNIFIRKSSSISSKSNLKIISGGTIQIGHNCKIHEYVFMHTYGGNIVIGNDCSFNPFCMVYGHGGITIGNKVRIATHTIIIPANHTFHNINLPIMEQYETRKGIIIEDDVWIGAGCKILDGVTIHKGSVIGAGSVVTKSIPPFSIAVGVPAKVLKTRGQEITSIDVIDPFLFSIFTHLTDEEKHKLYELVLSIPKESTIVEIGSYLGASSYLLASAAKIRNSIVHCVDTWQNHEMSEGVRDTFEEFKKNIISLSKYIVIHKGFSAEIAKKFDREIDMIFFDGGHSYETINSDWSNWSPRLKKNAIVVFHDTGWAEGVNKVIEENSSFLSKKDSLPNMWCGTKI